MGRCGGRIRINIIQNRLRQREFAASGIIEEAVRCDVHRGVGPELVPSEV